MKLQHNNVFHTLAWKGGRNINRTPKRGVLKMARKILEVKRLVAAMLRTVEMLYMVRLTK